MAWFNKKAEVLKKAIEIEKINRNISVKSVCIHGEESCIRCATEDFRQGSESNWQSLDDSDTRRIMFALPTKVVELMRRHPKKVVVAGGFLRATVAGEAVHDVDVFLPEEKGTKSWADDVSLSYEARDFHLHVKPKDECPEIQLIWRYPYTEPYEVPDQFDYTIAKAAVWFSDEKPAHFVGICHERFYRDLARKMLVYNCDRDVERVESFPRLLKYIRYGYSIDPDSLAELVVKTCLSMDLTDGFDGVLKQLKNAYNPIGTNADWEEMNKPYVKPKPKPPERSYDYGSGS